MALLAICNVAIDLGFSQKKTLSAEVLSPRLLNFRCFGSLLGPVRGHGWLPLAAQRWTRSSI